MLYNRLKKAKIIARKVFYKYNGKYPEQVTPEEARLYNGGVEAHLGTYRKTKVLCSGYCCGNPRKHFKEKTLAEKKADVDMKQQL